MSLYDLDARYGRRPRGNGRRALGVALAAFLVVALAWAAWAGGVVSGASIDWRATSVDTSDPTVARLSLEVTQAAGRASICSVRATDAAGQVVGWVDVPIPATASGRATTSTAVRTTRAAADAGVVTCVRR